jgi:hypothetical protein
MTGNFGEVAMTVPMCSLTDTACGSLSTTSTCNKRAFGAAPDREHAGFNAAALIANRYRHQPQALPGVRPACAVQCSFTAAEAQKFSCAPWCSIASRLAAGPCRIAALLLPLGLHRMQGPVTSHQLNTPNRASSSGKRVQQGKAVQLPRCSGSPCAATYIIPSLPIFPTMADPSSFAVVALRCQSLVCFVLTVGSLW